MSREIGLDQLDLVQDLDAYQIDLRSICLRVIAAWQAERTLKPARLLMAALHPHQLEKHFSGQNPRIAERLLISLRHSLIAPDKSTVIAWRDDAAWLQTKRSEVIVHRRLLRGFGLGLIRRLIHATLLIMQNDRDCCQQWPRAVKQLTDTHQREGES